MSQELESSKLGSNFINGAVSAAESYMMLRPERKLRSNVGAVCKRNHVDQDFIHYNSLADYLGLQNYKYEENLKNIPTRANDIKRKYPATYYERSNGDIREVPRLSVLAYSAIARETYKTRKLQRKTLTSREDVVEMKTMEIGYDKNEIIKGQVEFINEICNSCNTSMDPNLMLICAACESYYHTFCIDDSTDNIPEGWSEKNWNMLTDWNMCGDDESNSKLCESVKLSRNWICSRCTLLTNSFNEINDCVAKPKISVFGEEKRKKTPKRDKGEVLIMASHFPAYSAPTKLNIQNPNDTWKMIPNEVVADVSNVDIILSNDENIVISLTQFDGHPSSNVEINNSIEQNSANKFSDNYIDMKNVNQSKDNSHFIPSSSDGNQPELTHPAKQYETWTKAQKNTFLLREMNDNVAIKNNTSDSKDSKQIESCDNLKNLLKNCNSAPATHIGSDSDEVHLTPNN